MSEIRPKGVNPENEEEYGNEKDSSILVTEIQATPEVLDALKNKITIHFQKTANDGGDITGVDISVGDISAKVTFLDKAVAERVLKKQHNILNGPVNVQKYEHKIDASTGAAGVSHNDKTEDAAVDFKSLKNENEILQKKLLAVKEECAELKKEISKDATEVDNYTQTETSDETTDDNVVDLQQLKEENETLQKKLLAFKREYAKLKKQSSLKKDTEVDNCTQTETSDKTLFSQVVATFETDSVQLPYDEVALLIQQESKDTGTTCRSDGKTIIIKGYLQDVVTVHTRIQASLNQLQSSKEDSMATSSPNTRKGQVDIGPIRDTSQSRSTFSVTKETQSQAERHKPKYKERPIAAVLGSKPTASDIIKLPNMKTDDNDHTVKQDLSGLEIIGNDVEDKSKTNSNQAGNANMISPKDPPERDITTRQCPTIDDSGVVSSIDSGPKLDAVKSDLDDINVDDTSVPTTETAEKSTPTYSFGKRDDHAEGVILDQDEKDLEGKEVVAGDENGSSSTSEQIKYLKAESGKDVMEMPVSLTIPETDRLGTPGGISMASGSKRSDDGRDGNIKKLKNMTLFPVNDCQIMYYIFHIYEDEIQKLKDMFEVDIQMCFGQKKVLITANKGCPPDNNMKAYKQFEILVKRVEETVKAKTVDASSKQLGVDVAAQFKKELDDYQRVKKLMHFPNSDGKLTLLYEDDSILKDVDMTRTKVMLSHQKASGYLGRVEKEKHDLEPDIDKATKDDNKNTSKLTSGSTDKTGGAVVPEVDEANMIPETMKEIRIKEEYNVLYYIFHRLKKSIANIEEANNVTIDWKLAESTAHIRKRKECTPELFRKAKTEFETFLGKTKQLLTCKVVDASGAITRESSKAATVSVDKYDVILLNERGTRKYQIWGLSADIVDKAVASFCRAIGKAQSEPLLKQATVGEDMLSYIFHAYQDKLKEDEDKFGIEYVQKDHDIVIRPAKGNRNCTQETLEEAYETFVSFIQILHAKLASKDIEMKDKHLTVNDITKAVAKVHEKHEKVIIKETDKDYSYRIVGEQENIKVAMDTLFSHLGLSSPQSRHGGRKKHGPPTSERKVTSLGVQWPPGNSATLLEFNSREGTQVSIRHGDITKEDVDIICNAANSSLSHGAGVAGAIVKAGGYSIQTESNQIMKELRRQLNVAECVYTNAGHLRCQWVLHIVGPKWEAVNARVVREGLYNCCHNLLHSATKDKSAKSIAIPAIGTGIYGVPKQICAQVMLDAVCDFITKQDYRNQLRDIRFIDIDPETVQTFTDVFERGLQPLKLSVTKPHGRQQVAGATHGASGGEGTSVDPQHYGYSESPIQFTDTSSYPYESDRGISTERTFADATKGNLRGKYGTESKPSSENKGSSSVLDKTCAICLDEITKPRTLPCKHKFCKPCIDQAEKTNGPKCPTCTQTYGTVTGKMPHGKMTHSILRDVRCDGYDKFGTIVIYYDFPDGRQTSEHPNPGQWYSGTKRTAYLPNNKEGKEVLQLLKIAFDRRLTFTIGTSVTSGRKNTVVWNDIHHKTSRTGGSQNFGYPDATYFQRVRDELASKGVK